MITKPIYCIMHEWETLTVEGPDAQNFLHRLTTLDFKNLTPNTTHRGLLLNATGKIILYFHTLILKTHSYLLLVPRHENHSSASQYAQEILEKMHFREDLKIKAQGKRWSYFKILGTQGSFLNEECLLNPPFKFDLGILAHSEESLSTSLEMSGFLKQESIRPYQVLAGQPCVPYEINSTVNPLEIGLADCLSNTKGCYPGQEVIEKIRSRGQPPRKLVQFFGTGRAPAYLSPVFLENQVVGSLTSAESHPFEVNAWVGLGLVQRSLADPQKKFFVDNNPAQMKQLKDPLS